MPTPETTASTITTDELVAASSRRLFFGHMSVGKNVLSGVREVYAANNVAEPAMVELRPGESVPQFPSRAGLLAHSPIGANRDPEGKIANFAAALRNGVAEQVDIAMLKFCYADITWNTDVDTLFTSYQRTVEALQADFPSVTFIHITAPLTIPPSNLRQRVKFMIGRYDNAARARFNSLLRVSSTPERLFDLAAIESRAPEGGPSGRALYPGYSSDGAHLNASGSVAAATGFLRILARWNPAP